MKRDHYFFNDFVKGKTCLTSLTPGESEKISCKWLTSKEHFPAVINTFIKETIRNSNFQIAPVCIEDHDAWKSDPDQTIIMGWEIINKHFLRKGKHGSAFLDWIKNEKTGSKIFCKQDEHLCNSILREIIDVIKPEAILTCTSSPEDAEKIYGDINAKYYHVYPGYLESTTVKDVPIAERYIDVLNRGRWLTPSYGKLGFLKGAIGEEFVRYNIEKSCNLNINHSNNYLDRVEEEIEWRKLLTSSKSILSTPTGCNVIFEKYENKSDLLDLSSLDARGNKIMITYDHFIKAHREGKEIYKEDLNFETVSPKMFQAAAHKTALIMYEGRYAGLFRPNIHYISLKRDHSNMREVVEKIKDVNYVQNMVDVTYRDVVKSNLYTYKQHAMFLDAAISNCL